MFSFLTINKKIKKNINIKYIKYIIKLIKFNKYKFATKI